jgi:hydrogenase expression/formation protein HypD
VSQVLVPPAIDAIVGTPGNRVQAFLAPGHVCTVVGTADYADLARRHRVPVAITGFEPVDLLAGVLAVVQQLREGRAEMENRYARVVRPSGAEPARRLLEDVFEVCDRKWRGIGTIPASGYRLRPAFAEFDAERVFDVGSIETAESPECIAGAILRGVKKPHDCAAFGVRCTPSSPLGATMVSSEGACAAYFASGRPARKGLPLAPADTGGA